MSQSTHILAFYAFSPIKGDALPNLRAELLEFGAVRGMRGLVLLATEGINGTVCGSAEAIGEWRTLIGERFTDVTWNESAASELVFPRWLVKIREEIVALNMPESSPLNGTHLSPAEWNAMMEEDDVVVVDARNTYETKIGMFDGAIDPAINNFQGFNEFSASCEIPKEKKVMLYCTGGIRCEKAVVAMKNAGYEHVFQLQGGILGYLKEFPEKKFSGECFVFDHRVAVDQHLEPSKTYGLCVSCGDPGTETASCEHCDSSFIACIDCLQMKKVTTCSKNCRYHHERTTSLTGARRS